MTIAIRILALPLIMVFYVLKHPRYLILIALVVGVIFAFNTCNKINSAGRAEVPKYQTIAPDKADAPNVIVTSSRVYYVVSYTDDGKFLTLHDYYTYDRKRWERQHYPIPLNKGELKIYER